MCGITGIYNLNKKPVEYFLMQEMTKALKHRGPDDSGVYIDKNLGLGQTRLSIIDLSEAGHQPMSNHDQTVWIVFNGEIYNFREIRAELENKGHKFKSNSDTEVIIKSYEEWGMDSIKKFRGMFTFAIWDKNKEKIFLVRDRAGVKPLYYYLKDNLFLFSSELKSFHKHPSFAKEINFDALALFFQFGYILAPDTIFKNAYKLKPGHYLEINENGRLREIKYWDIIDYYLAEPINKSEQEIELELEKILLESFKYRMISDVPVGIFLSGGIDSSLVTAFLQKNSGTALKTFTVGFNELGYNEAPYAKKIAEFLGTDHNELYCAAKDVLEIIPKFPEIYDEPFGDSSGIPTFLLSKFAKEKVKVALSADAGDELFCGYSKYGAINSYYNFIKKMPKPLLTFSSFGLSVFSPEVISGVYNILPFVPKYTNIKGKIYKFKNMLRCKNKNLRGIFKNSGSFWTEDQIEKILAIRHLADKSQKNNFCDFDRVANLPPISQMQAVDYKTYLCDDIFTKVDRATMAAGIEAREPLADHKLSEYVARIPVNFKYKKRESKYILRKILYKHVPKDLLERPKQGFEIPIDKWLKKDLRGILRQYLSEKSIKRQGIFDEHYINKSLDNYLSGKSDSAYKFWFLLVFQMWQEKWLKL